MKNKILPFQDLPAIRRKHSRQMIVHCHGVFDLFHHGHLRHLRSAKENGDLLVVSITPDRYVNKGPGRPRFSEGKRLEMLSALEFVDYVVLNRFPKAVELIQALRPNFYVKGPDYKNQNGDITGGIYQEEAAVREVGGKLIFTDDDTESATELINTFFHEWNHPQRRVIESIRKEFGLDRVLEMIDSLREMPVVVVGEPIVDTYVFCRPENLSSKSSSISANFIREENYAGGSWAVARHLDSLGCHVTLLSPVGEEGYATACLEHFQADCNVEVIPMRVRGIQTPRKIRYLSPFMNQRIFELTYLDPDRWMDSDLNGFGDMFYRIGKDAEAILVLDFGHGLWEGSRLKTLRGVNAFKALNVQTNSGNYGYNLFHKHRDYDYLVLDERELRLGMQDRFTSVKILADKASEMIHAPFSVTLGGNGSLHVDAGGFQVKAPSYFKEPVDTTGAGDAFFALTSVLCCRGCTNLLLPFLGNLFAGLKTRIVGNKCAVDRIDFIRTVTSLLK